MNDELILDKKYRVLYKLGSGGFGLVYLAEDALAKRKVAIKILRNRDSNDESDLIREIEFLASLKHNSIVAFHHHFIDNSILHLVMEYCAGGSLADLIEAKDSLTLDEALKIATDVCSVFEFIHSKNIVHRDIKPNNIMIDADGKVKVSDFGIANTHGGTVSYMAPELYTADYISSRDPKVDIYALGITSLEMILGHNPFRSYNAQEVLAQKINHSFIPTTLPNWIQEIILKATNPVPELRFQSATEFKEAIIAKNVPYTFNKNRLSADKVFNAANKSLTSKNWKKAINYIEIGLDKCSNSALGLLTAGKYHLKVNNLTKAKEYFEKAVKLNPGVSIKKELANINILEGNYSQAISHLQNHLQLNPVDWEAYNLLAECFFRIQRFDTALEIIDSVINEAKADALWNNWYIIKNCIDHSFVRLNRDIGKRINHHHFIRTNFNLINEMNKNKIDSNNRMNKLVYQDFRFNKYTAQNICVILSEDGKKKEFNQPIVSIGRNPENDFVVDDDTVSRRHCIIINYPKDLWILDMGSKYGVYIDDKKIKHKQFLLGKHKICVGSYEFDFYSSEGILI